MKVLNLSASGLTIALLSVLVSPSALASECGSGLIEVTYAGSETCVAPEQFATLSPAVQATADREDVAEAMGQDDDSSGADDSEDNNSAATNDDNSDGSTDDSDDSSDDSGDDNSDNSGQGGSDGGSSSGGDSGSDGD